jgi:hypothetical protein
MKPFFLSFLLTASFCQAQTVLTPGDKTFDKNLIKSGTHDMACYTPVNGQQTEVGTFTVQINSGNNNLAVYSSFQAIGETSIATDTSISEGATFKPVYRSSINNFRNFVIHYGKEITGFYYDKQAKKKYSIKDAPGGSFFDSYTYPYLLCLLPLTTGYKNELAVYDYKPTNQTNTKKARIEEVKSDLFKSSLTGDHKVWQVTIHEDVNNDSYVYYIDKDTRRIWKIEMSIQGTRLTMIDRETDYNPFTTKFDQAETLKLIKNGKSIILGQVFARDHVEGSMAYLNINKKQFAHTGTNVLLIPYTPFFKEWFKLNEASRKKGRSIPLPKEAAACIKSTTVYDDEGHFEFTSLMPGDYYLYTEFTFVHKYTQTEVIGYTDTYINGAFQGTTANTKSYDAATSAGTTAHKVITIKTDGEKAEVKLKSTM